MWAVTAEQKGCSITALWVVSHSRDFPFCSWLNEPRFNPFTALLAWFCLLSEAMSNNVRVLKVTLKRSTLVKRLHEILCSSGGKDTEMKSPQHKRQEKELSPFAVCMIFRSDVAENWWWCVKLWDSCTNPCYAVNERKTLNSARQFY